MRNLIDISLPLKPSGIVYPGNPEVAFEPQDTQSNIITKISFGSHSGTHIDAPSHAKIEGGATIDQISLETFYGEARVLDLANVSESIKVEDLESKNIQKGERILLKTSNSGRWSGGVFF